MQEFRQIAKAEGSDKFSLSMMEIPDIPGNQYGLWRDHKALYLVDFSKDVMKYLVSE